MTYWNLVSKTACLRKRIWIARWQGQHSTADVIQKYSTFCLLVTYYNTWPCRSVRTVSRCSATALTNQQVDTVRCTLVQKLVRKQGCRPKNSRPMGLSGRCVGKGRHGWNVSYADYVSNTPHWSRKEQRGPLNIQRSIHYTGHGHSGMTYNAGHRTATRFHPSFKRMI